MVNETIFAALSYIQFFKRRTLKQLFPKGARE